MTFKKVHNKRQLLPTASSTPAATTSSTYVGHSPIQPTGPPLVLTTSTASRASVSGSASSVSASASVSGSTSSASTVSTTPPVVAPVVATRTSSPVATITRSTTRTTTSHSSTATVAAASTEDSGGMGVGTMAGIAAAAIVGIGVITAFIVWFMRRRNKNRDIDEEPFNRNSFLRQSTAIPDDDAPPPSRVRPQPSMAERQPTPSYAGGQTYSDMGHDGFGYNTQPSYIVQPAPAFGHPYGPGGAPATPLPYSPGFGTTYDQQQGFNNGGYTDLTRGGPNHEYPPSPRGYDQYEANSPSYVGHDNFPMPPPAAAGSAMPMPHDNAQAKVQYPELTPATTSAQQGQVVSVRDSVYNGRETPVQLGFAPVPHSSTQGAPGQAHQQQGHAPARGARPETVYDPEDAYGGI